MFEGEYFVFRYSGDATHGGNPLWILQVQEGRFVDIFNPYDFDEMGEFVNERRIDREAIASLKRLGVEEIFTFNAEDDKRYFGRPLSHCNKDQLGDDDICTFSRLRENELKKEGIKVRRLNQSDLEAHCSS